jgi:hypothetical protein
MLVLPNNSRLDTVRPASIMVSISRSPRIAMRQIIPLVLFKDSSVACALVMCSTNRVHSRR